MGSSESKQSEKHQEDKSDTFSTSESDCFSDPTRVGAAPSGHPQPQPSSKSITACKTLIFEGNNHFHRQKYNESYHLYIAAVCALMKPTKDPNEIRIEDVTCFVDDMLEETQGYVKNLMNKEDRASLQGGINRIISDAGEQCAKSEENATPGMLRQLKYKAEICDCVGDLMNNLGAACFANGDIVQALEIYSKALPLKRVVGGESLASAEILQNMAMTFERMGRFEEAENALVEALQIESELGFECSTEHTSTLNNLGVLFFNMGSERLEESEVVLTKVVQLRRELFGSDHHLTANAQVNLDVVRKHLRTRPVCSEHKETIFNDGRRED